MPILQEIIQKIIHHLEEAAGARYVRYTLAFLLLIGLAITYDLRQFRNFSSIEAFDNAQLARQIASGKGYTTQFIRPFSMFLLKRKALGPEAASATVIPADTDPCRIKGPHPDISNAPVYPVFLAGVMTVLPFDSTLPNSKRMWAARYQPEFLVALSNQFLLGVLIVLSFFWARRMFDRGVAWVVAALLLGCDLLWRFTISGLSTLLLMVILMGLVWCLTLLEADAREPKRGFAWQMSMAAAIGLTAGLAMLTRYSMIWLIVPVLGFLILFGGARRGALCMAVLVVFAAVALPWMARNYHLSGEVFGTATYSALQGTELFPKYRLERSLEPNVRVITSLLWMKLIANARPLLESICSHLGGWITGFFLAGLLVGFKNPGLRRVRYFVFFSLVLFIIIDSVGRTQLSEDYPDVNGENQLVLLVPFILTYGAGLFFMLLDQVKFPIPTLRYPTIALFSFLACIPFALALLGSPAGALNYPPYHPQWIRQTAQYLKEDELMMSDVPWAVAWYGDRTCVWLTLNATGDPQNSASAENFLTINDFIRPIHGLYLTQVTMDGRFVSDWITSGESSWGSFVIDTVLRKEEPAEFPLHEMPEGYLPEQMFLTDWKRW